MSDHNIRRSGKPRRHGLAKIRNFRDGLLKGDVEKVYYGGMGAVPAGNYGGTKFQFLGNYADGVQKEVYLGNREEATFAPKRRNESPSEKQWCGLAGRSRADECPTRGQKEKRFGPGQNGEGGSDFQEVSALAEKSEMYRERKEKWKTYYRERNSQRYIKEKYWHPWFGK